MSEVIERLLANNFDLTIRTDLDGKYVTIEARHKYTTAKVKSKYLIDGSKSCILDIDYVIHHVIDELIQQISGEDTECEECKIGE